MFRYYRRSHRCLWAIDRLLMQTSERIAAFVVPSIGEGPCIGAGYGRMPDEVEDMRCASQTILRSKVA